MRFKIIIKNLFITLIVFSKTEFFHSYTFSLKKLDISKSKYCSVLSKFKNP